jgi:hypothetical protein
MLMPRPVENVNARQDKFPSSALFIPLVHRVLVIVAGLGIIMMQVHAETNQGSRQDWLAVHG